MRALLNRVVGVVLLVAAAHGARADVAPDAGAPTLRAEVGKPLQAAQELLKAQRYAEALAKINEAEAAPERTGFETFTIERMRGAVAASSGDADLALRSYEAVLATGRLAPEEARLHLGVALVSAGQKAKALPVLKAVQGTDGSAELARLWLVLASSKNNES
jgi:hypothetical protein